MKPAGQAGEGCHVFEAAAACAKSGLHGFTVRVRPDHPDLTAADGVTPFLPALIAWAELEKTGARAAR